MVPLPTRPPAAEPSYQHGVSLGDVPPPGVSHPPGRPVELRLHVADETFRGRRELLPLRHAAGIRVYVHARPSVLVPDYRLAVALAVALTAAPSPGEPVGRVMGVAQRGWRRLDVGTARAWRSPAEGLLIVWEASLHDGHRAGADPDPATDPAVALLWDGFEGALLWHLALWGPVRRLVTTWEDVYPRRWWQAFLEARGSLPRPRGAFVKRRLPRPAGRSLSG